MEPGSTTNELNSHAQNWLEDPLSWLKQKLKLIINYYTNQFFTSPRQVKFKLTFEF